MGVIKITFLAGLFLLLVQETAERDAYWAVQEASCLVLVK